jgi:hypothetical protein
MAQPMVGGIYTSGSGAAQPASHHAPILEMDDVIAA